MKIEHGKGTSQYGPGVDIELDGDELVSAIHAFIVAHGFHIEGARTTSVNGKRCESARIYVDPSGFVITPQRDKVDGRGPSK